MSKKFSKFMAGLMAALMVGSILPTEYLTSFAVDTDKNSIKFVDTYDKEVYIENSNASIKAETYQKDISLKVQFDYSIDYSTNKSYDVGEMVYYMPSWGYYENDIGANYIIPDNISVNNGSDIWEYETTTLNDSNGGKRVVLKISNKVELTSSVVTSGYMQFGLTMNARNVCNGSKFLTNNITILASEDGGKTGKQLNSLTWDVTTYLDEFNLQENVADVSVANASDLGSDADDYYWAKYTIDASVAKLKTTPATGFQLDITIPEGAILYSVNGDKDSTGTITFDLDDWNYTSSETAKTFTVFVKYPKSKFDGESVTPSASLKALYNGTTKYVEVATSQVTHELHDYDVKYDGDLFAVNTSANKGYEISWNSLNRNEASPFSFYMSALSNYASEDGYGMIIFDDALEIMQNNGTFVRLSDEDYEFTSVTIYDLSHFTNSSGGAYTSLEYMLLDQDNQVISGTNGNVADITSSNGKTITLPSGTTSVSVYFPDLTSTLYLDSSAIKVNGVINPVSISASNIMQEGELRNLVGLFAVKDNGDDEDLTVMNIVEKDNYTGVDADRLAQADLDNYGTYVQRDLDFINVVYKSSQINVETSFDPSTSTYDEENDVQTSTLTISSFFAAPGEVESFSVFDILPEGMEFDENDITYSISKATNSPSTITLKDGIVITADNADAYIAKHATVKLTSDYKGSGRTLVTIDFDFSDNAVCYDATSDNGFTSGKIVANLPVQVENKDATYDNIAALIFNDEHSETILKTTDNGEAPLVKAESSLWTDINGNGKVDEIVDYASATLTSIYTAADNVKENPSIKITKTADKDIYQNGETIVYTIVVTNNGDVALTGVKVTETLDGAFDAKDGVTIDGKVATIGDLAVGASVTLTYKVAVPANSKDGDTVKNVVSVTSNEKASDEAKKDVTIEVPTTTTTNPSIKITKTADKDVYQNGETIVYTIVVTNNGDVALTGVKVTETLDGAFDAKDGVTINGKVATIGDLAVGASVTLTYKVAVPANSKDGDTVKNVVSVTSNEKASDEAKKDVTIEVPTTPVTNPSIKITKTSDKETYQNGETIVYTIKVTNNGDVALTGVKVTETLDGSFVAQDRLTIDGKTATIANLAVGETVSMTFKVAVPANSKDGAVIKNVVSVTTNEKATDTTEKDVNVEVPVTFVSSPSLEIVKTTDKATYNPGETVTYTIKVTNNGNVDLTNVNVVETLNGKWANVSSNVTVKDDKNAVISSLKIGASETLTYTYVISEDASNNASIKNIVKANESTYNLNVSDDVTITVKQIDKPSLDITKTADKKAVKAGETITYTIVVTNNGNVDLTNISVIDSLTSGSFAEVSDVTRVNDYSLIIPTLKVGESRTFTFTYVVDEDTTATSIENVATAYNPTYNLTVSDKVNVTITKSLIETIPEVVQTGDNAPMFLFLGLAIIALIGMCVVTKISSKKKNNK